ncbi:hypothetical protein M885DRAFT_287120 [Pelagophyceae sp. CCMP2097]|nr:hypothetical protein M885DRAFT_287120 [Pelagophyceae sp. CCMP2097]
MEPTMVPTVAPSAKPSPHPSAAPKGVPTMVPTVAPLAKPSPLPSAAPTGVPTATPTTSAMPSPLPSAAPTDVPTGVPTMVPTVAPSAKPRCRFPARRRRACRRPRRQPLQCHRRSPARRRWACRRRRPWRHPRRGGVRWTELSVGDFNSTGGSLRDACRGRAGRGRAVTKRAPKISVERGHRVYLADGTRPTGGWLTRRVSWTSRAWTSTVRQGATEINSTGWGKKTT